MQSCRHEVKQNKNGDFYPAPPDHEAASAAGSDGARQRRWALFGGVGLPRGILGAPVKLQPCSTGRTTARPTLLAFLFQGVLTLHGAQRGLGPGSNGAKVGASLPVAPWGCPAEHPGQHHHHRGVMPMPTPPVFILTTCSQPDPLRRLRTTAFWTFFSPRLQTSR